MSVSFCLSHPVAVSAFIICRGLCACSEMLWIGVLYVSFGSKESMKFFLLLTRQKLYVGMVVCISWLHSCLCVWM